MEINASPGGRHAVTDVTLFLRRQVAGGKLDDVVGGWIRAHIAEAVLFVRGFEDDAAGADNVRLAVLHGCEGAVADDHEFLGGVMVRWMGFLAGVQGGDVDLQIGEGGRGGIADGAGFADFGLMNFEVGPLEDAGVQRGFGGGLGKGGAGDGSGQGDASYNQISTGKHGAISPGNGGRVNL